MSRRVAPYPRRRQSPQKFQPRIIFYDTQQKLQERCRICSLTSNLISVCDCTFKYHEKCLLNFIKEQMKKSLSTQLVFNASSIKCQAPMCQKQILFLHEERHRYGCEFFCQKISENKCNKYLVLILILFLILGAFVFVCVYLAAQLEKTVAFVLFCIFSLLSLIIAVIIVGAFIVCISKYFQIKEIILKSIVKPKINQLSEGGDSNSSDQNKNFQIYSQNFQIIVSD